MEELAVEIGHFEKVGPLTWLKFSLQNDLEAFLQLEWYTQFTVCKQNLI